MPPKLRLASLRASAQVFCERSLYLNSLGVPVTSAFIRSGRPHTSHFPSQSNFTTPASLPPFFRSFSTTTSHLKKGSPKSKSKSSSSSSTDHTHIPDNKAQANRDASIDPCDFTNLEAQIAHQIDRLKDSLSKLRSGAAAGGGGAAGGRLSPQVIENLTVEIKHGLGGEGGKGKQVEKVRLGDLATVVARGGRNWCVLVNEEKHLKPITSSIQSSPYSLTPQPDPQNPTSQLNIPIPPPTAESRAQALADAKVEFEKATEGVREARAAWQKWYRKAERERLVIRDELVKAHKRMEGVVEKGIKACKEVYERAIRGMGR